MKDWVRTMIMCGALVLAWGFSAATVKAQVGYGMSGDGAYGRGMDMAAILMQQRVFTAALGARGGGTPRMTKAQRLAQQRAIQAQRERGRLMIRSGNVTTTFQPTGRLVSPSILAAAHSLNADSRQKLEQIYSDYVRNYEEVVHKQGKPTNDVAITLSNLISAARQVCLDAPPLTEAQFGSLVGQVRAFLLKNEMFAGRNNVEKQRAHEDIAIAWSDIGTYYFKARRTGDQNLLSQVRQSARQLVEHHTGGMSLSDIHVTETSVRLPVK